jgi:hypothetical protein
MRKSSSNELEITKLDALSSDLLINIFLNLYAYPKTLLELSIVCKKFGAVLKQPFFTLVKLRAK